MGTSTDVTTCQYPAAHHSADVVTVWHGAAEPLVVCGYHEASVDLTTLVRLAS